MDPRDMLENSKRRFDFDAWPRRPEAEIERRVRHFALDPHGNGPDWVFEGYASEGDGLYASYFHRREDPAQRVMLRVSEHGDHETARLALLGRLTHFTIFAPPRLDQSDIALGDVGYFGGGAAFTSTIFVRWNILIDIRSIGDTPVSVLDMAQTADAQVLAAAHP